MVEMVEPQSEVISSKPQVEIYTDGGCQPNPGPGGYGVVLLHSRQRMELSGGFRKTTNNRMEIYAAIRGLEALRTTCQVTLYSDSKYVVEAMNQGWALNWQRRGGFKTDKQPAANYDLWVQLLGLCKKHIVKFIWVRGHAGNKENERCDELSTAALKTRHLASDAGYESGLPGVKPPELFS